MARAFGRETPVMRPKDLHRGRSTWLLWPALQYRVVTPLVDEPELNVFQRGILGLAQCGERDPGRWAELLGLEPEFAQLVRDGLSTMQYLDEHNAPTEAGLKSLDDGFLDPTRIVVTHVYQDPFTGAIWPAHVENPVTVSVRWVAEHKAKLDVARDAATATVTAIAVPGPDLGKVERPTSAEILEQVSRGRRIEVWGEHGERWRRRGPDRITARVSALDSGEPVYLPVQIAVSQPKGAERSWTAINPFTGRPYERLRRSVLNRCSSHERLGRELQRLIGRPAEAHLIEYDQMRAERKSRYRARFEVDFGGRLRGHPELAELLTMVEFHWENARASADNDADLELTTNYAWRAHEVVLRGLPTRWPVPPWPAASSGDPSPWRKLMEVCKRIGLEGNEYRNLSTFFKKNDEIKRALLRVESGKGPKNPDLMLFAVLSAGAHGSDHPVQNLIGKHPYLLTEWSEASAARNSGSHGPIERTALSRAEIARQLAFVLTECFLKSLHPSDEGKEPPAHGQEQAQHPQGTPAIAAAGVAVNPSRP
jgi:hypothetical protein